MFNQMPPEPPTINILRKEIKLQTCIHLTPKNVKNDLVLYKVINKEGKRTYFGTCSLCYLTNNSKMHTGVNDD